MGTNRQEAGRFRRFPLARITFETTSNMFEVEKHHEIRKSRLVSSSNEVLP